LKITRTFHRRNLPHLYYNEGTYFITFRLHNSIPAAELARIKAEAANGEKHIFRQYDNLLHTSETGGRYLLLPPVADICRTAMHYPDGKSYKLICYCIMPNHIHLVFELLPSDKKNVGKIMQSIKRFSARKSNLLLNRTGTFWQEESYDRLVRDDRELYNVRRYVLLNPVKAGLTDDWQSWQYTFCRQEYLVI
jgi:putative transposase